MTNKIQFLESLNNKKGFALISTLLVLAVLTVIGIAVTNSTTFELKIAGNEKVAAQRFYAADSGWKQSGPYLNAKATAPIIKNLTLKTGDTSYDWNNYYYKLIRNFGDGANGTLNEDFPDTDVDGAITNIPYWYRVIYQDDSQAIAFGDGYRDFQYQVDCNANNNAQVNTGVKKVYRVGY